MGKYGHVSGSALHRGWKKHEKVIRKTKVDFDA